MPRSTDPLVIGRVIGDVLEPFTSSIPLRVIYNNCSAIINCCELKSSQIVRQPRVEVGGDDLRTFYTLIMVDPDAPSPGDPNQREYLNCLPIFPKLIAMVGPSSLQPWLPSAPCSFKSTAMAAHHCSTKLQRHHCVYLPAPRSTKSATPSKHPSSLIFA
ncbi:PEBP-like superfamily [Sesbania bispinosa]|nr:PEBP-like superfamily [Sesbania bispinosa]